MQQQPDTPENDKLEVEARDILVTRLAIAGEKLAMAADLSRAANDSEGAKNYAAAAHDLAKALALLAPIEAADDLVAKAGSRDSSGR